ncbi:MAG: LysR substrate-binding domain-containing protein [Methylococcales bacterium]
MKFIHSSNNETGTINLPPLMSLRAFERAAERQSFRLAAQELSLTPSAISHQVRGLEHHFGVRLFVRTGRSILLTPAGENYLTYVKSALLLLERGSRSLTPIESKNREIRVSALPFFVSAIMLARLDKFLNKFPNISLRLEATAQYADFEGSGVDLAIRMGREKSIGLHFDKLLDVRALPVCAASLARGNNAIKTTSDLAKHTLIHVSQHPGAWRTWLENADCSDLKPKGDMWFDNVSLALEAAEHGLGIALGMDPIIRNWPTFGKALVAPLAPSPKSTLTYYSVCRPEQKDDPVILAMRRWLIQCTKDVRSV